MRGKGLWGDGNGVVVLQLKAHNRSVFGLTLFGWVCRNWSELGWLDGAYERRAESRHRPFVRRR